MDFAKTQEYLKTKHSIGAFCQKAAGGSALKLNEFALKGPTAVSRQANHWVIGATAFLQLRPFGS